MPRLAWNNIRCDPFKSCASIAIFALAAGMIVSGGGTLRGIGSDAGLQRVLMGDWLAGLFLVVACVALLYVAVGKYAEVSERTEEFGILAVLGARYRYLLSLLGWETAIVAVPGAIGGIVLALAVKLVIASFFSRILACEPSFFWFALAVLASGAASFAGGALALRAAMRDGVVGALSYKK